MWFNSYSTLSANRNLIRTQFGLGYFLYVKSFRKGFFFLFNIGTRHSTKIEF